MGTVGIGDPAQTERHPGAGWALRQLGIGVGQPALGRRDQLLKGARDLADEVVLQNLALALIEQPLAILHLHGQRLRQLRQAGGVPTERDLDDDALFPQ